MLAELAAELVPVADLRPLPGLPRPHPARVAALAVSVKSFGVLEPLLVRPARQSWVLQEGRRRGVWGWFLIDTRRVAGRAYDGDPAFYLTHRAAKEALPADVPWEVVRGLGRLAAARMCRLRLVPCAIQELTDAEVAALRAFA